MKTISNIILDKSIKETPFLKTAKDSDGNQITLSEQMAYLTHFIQNHKISHKLSYSQKALEIIKEVSEYLNATDEGNDIVSEPAVDYSYSLFSDIVHPRFPSVANHFYRFVCWYWWFQNCASKFGRKMCFFFRMGRKCPKNLFLQLWRNPIW